MQVLPILDIFLGHERPSTGVLGVLYCVNKSIAFFLRRSPLSTTLVLNCRVWQLIDEVGFLCMVIGHSQVPVPVWPVLFLHKVERNSVNEIF
jgi:hypothetical protein